jgi:hypothetical protein
MTHSVRYWYPSHGAALDHYQSINEKPYWVLLAEQSLAAAPHSKSRKKDLRKIKEVWSSVRFVVIMSLHSQFGQKLAEQITHPDGDFRDRRTKALTNQRPAWFGELDRFVVSEIRQLQRTRELITGVKWHMDHMIPILGKGASGLHCAANLQLIPRTINKKKGNRLIYTKPFEWLPDANEAT